jgi:hypothetical protein
VLSFVGIEPDGQEASLRRRRLTVYMITTDRPVNGDAGNDPAARVAGPAESVQGETAVEVVEGASGGTMLRAPVWPQPDGTARSNRWAHRIAMPGPP